MAPKPGTQSPRPHLGSLQHSLWVKKGKAEKEGAKGSKEVWEEYPLPKYIFGYSIDQSIMKSSPFTVLHALYAMRSSHEKASLSVCSFVCLSIKCVDCNKTKQVAQLSQRDRAAGWVSYCQKWKTGTGRQYLRTI